MNLKTQKNKFVVIIVGILMVLFTLLFDVSSRFVYAGLTVTKTLILADNVDKVVFNPEVEIELLVSQPATATSQGTAQRSLKTTAHPLNPVGVTDPCCNDQYCDLGESIDICAADCGGYHGCGELTGDGIVDIWDYNMLINRVFMGGQLPTFIAPWRADLDNSGFHDVLDVTRMIDVVFREKPEWLDCVSP